MLVLGRKVGEKVVVMFGQAVMTVEISCRNGNLYLAFDAPRDVQIVREELTRELPRAGKGRGL